MTTYIRPDRSNRPTSSDDPMNFSRECNVGQERGGVLADGRPYVTETAFVEGYTLVYFYFDVAGLETARVEELQALLERSGMVFANQLEPGATIKKDGQRRPIWEFQVTYCND